MTERTNDKPDHHGGQKDRPVEGGGTGDGTAPDQRTPDDAERSDENRGINSADTEELER